MKKKIEQILNGKFKYDQPELLFSKEKLEEAGISRAFYNNELDSCVQEIKQYIQENDRL